ncbi:hypothetical protein M595_1669 [Lyngbya aestuarii BL J]|uniref:Uncharacterized protein n=1 Tax=Lyngbya aestuarii BL J TaxID=1348334 RepID=U7QKE3_9CYAN|nr:hypothetical protein M595_1669 [Lyngbya aestuarii BL J]
MVKKAVRGATSGTFVEKYRVSLSLQLISLLSKTQLEHIE